MGKDSNPLAFRFLSSRLVVGDDDFRFRSIGRHVVNAVGINNPTNDLSERKVWRRSRETLPPFPAGLFRLLDFVHCHQVSASFRTMTTYGRILELAKVCTRKSLRQMYLLTGSNRCDCRPSAASSHITLIHNDYVWGTKSFGSAYGVQRSRHGILGRQLLSETCRIYTSRLV